jgi:hypothetical protein
MKSLACCTVLLFACRAAWADCCEHCGCESPCRKVCRLVCETEKVPKTTYDCACEEFCVPGPSKRTTVCDACGNKHQVYTPTCGKLRTRTKLVKHETFEEKIVYKWVVEDVCCQCAAQVGEGGAADGAAPAVRSADVAGARFDARRLFKPLERP